MTLKGQALLDELAGRYPVVGRTGGWICLGWPQANPEQTVQVTCATKDGAGYALLTADLMPADAISERDALELAAKLLVGNLIIQKGILTIRYVLADGFSNEELDEAILTVRNNAVRLRTRLLDRQMTATRKLLDRFL